MYQEEIESAQTAFQMDQEEQAKQEAIADEHLKEINCGKVLQLRRKAYKKGYDNAIEKACEWLKNNMYEGTCEQILSKKPYPFMQDFINEFKKTMEE